LAIEISTSWFAQRPHSINNQQSPINNESTIKDRSITNFRRLCQNLRVSLMSLDAGTRLGPYQIVALIGAGGMGEVYRARDSRLNRDVALKVLPDQFASDADRLARFQREAQVLASLNHPNIAAIHGLEEGALILELVEGPTLADRLTTGPIPLDEALPIARQIAAALDAAHEHGVIHRDLKPANIKLRPDGTVKVLDFGLAKFAEGDGAREGSGPIAASQSPTITTPAMTRQGMILGTAAYMAPEQAKGHPVDKRADIWSFGCVLYELLTGRRAFQSDDLSETLATVLKGEPDWTIWPAAVPASMSALVRRCLAKDPSRRIADATTALFVFNDLATAPPEVASASHDSPNRFALSIASGLVIASVAALAAGAAVWFWRAPRTEDVYRSTIQATLTSDPNVGTALSLSPDGRQLAYIGLDAKGNRLVYIRPLDELMARPLPGTERAQMLFWSPDSRDLAFVADNKLQRIDTRGKAPIVLAQESRSAQPGSWSTENVILYTPTAGSPLFRISSIGGGTPSPVTTPGHGSRRGHARVPVLSAGRPALRLYGPGEWRRADWRLHRLPRFDGANPAVRRWFQRAIRPRRPAVHAWQHADGAAVRRAQPGLYRRVRPGCRSSPGRRRHRLSADGCVHRF
jgi:serine/threonine protein kinase